ncbi:ATP-binding protein [Thiohalorhabdus sp. Cl-TMA]|uniref:histidine kinase n=1 Tax=Thiohalorhabdus methylotrophus TaxID=3242694 RepID=A0ABV4TWF8_9GAMM
MGNDRATASRILSRHSGTPDEEPAPEELRARLTQQVVVAELGEMGLRGESLEALFRETVIVLAEVLEVAYTKILRNEPRSGTARLIAGVGWEEGLEGEAVVSTGLESQAGYTLLCDEPVIVADLRSETRFSGPPLLHEHGVVSGMSVVIQGHQGPYGVLGVHSREPREFTGYDVSFLKAVANVLGASIQRTAMEGALRRSEGTFHETFTHAGMGIAILDLDGRLLEVNPAYAGLLRYRQDELMDGTHTVQQLIHPEDWPATEAAMARLRDGEVPFYSMEKRVRHKDGGLIWVQVTVTVRPGDDGHDRQLIAIVEDITKRREAEEAMVEADRRKDEFLSMLGHELRNPLTPIATMGEVLSAHRDRMDPERLDQAAATIKRQSTHLTRIVDDLLDLNRIKTGRITLKKERVDLRGCAQQAVESVSAAARDKRHELTVELPDQPLAATGDAVRLTQILANLLDNAVKYTDPGGNIRLVGDRENGRIRFRVRDDGRGVSPEHLARLFDDFDRGGLRSTGPKGLGLGLAVVRRLVDLHDGEVEAHSEGVGRGSEFLVRFPAADSPEEDRQPESRGTAPGGAREVLVVEDDMDVARSLSFLLESMGYQTRHVASGEQAFDAVREISPGMVLIDIGLPDLSGFEVARKLRSRLGGAPLVALTGHSRAQFPEESVTVFDEYLLKPPTARILQKTLERMESAQS